jgi:hypothetical protein
VVVEEGRSLTAKDVSHVTAVPVAASVTASERVARTIDAGLLVTRLTRLHEPVANGVMLEPEHEQVARIDELHDPPPLGALAVGDDPDVGRDARVVEQLVRKSDNGVEPVVSMIQRRISDSPEPAAPVNIGEPLKTIARREPPCSGGRIFEIMCWRNSSEPSLM